ncbi:hypothetical protein [Lentzea sp. NBRC 105346]|uniref:hypothetical protein n=1 Tax=Lentzea sp. NBRC 105346 TaxID=3032205 RepID=UPI0025550239|nr:hypothetical protein [Lentzea sp. NBRC 105346]
MRNGRRYALLLVFALFGAFLLTSPGSQPKADGPSVTVAGNVAHQTGAAPRPHNEHAAYVPHGHLPADHPPVAGMPRSLRFLVGAAKRMHRTPDELHTSRHGNRAPPRPSGS